MDLKNKIKNFPDSPGVYIFSGKNKVILYVGRATSLKKRVAQYFQKRLDPRIEEMVSLAKDIKYQSTDTILDSVVLEANLIKKYWPKYNIKDKDGRSFVYIVISKKDYPYPFLVRGQELKKFPTGKNKIFGPYQSSSLVKNTLRIIRRVFSYSTCRPNSGRACFDYQLGLCPGLCVGEVDKITYQKNIKNIILLLSGQKNKLLKKLAKDNPEQANSLKYLQDVSLISREDSLFISSNRIEGYDISHLTGRETYGAMVVASDGQLQNSQYRLFKIKTAPESDDLRALVEVLERRLKHIEWPYPDLIMIDGGRPQIDFVDNFLKKNHINIPIVGISKLAGDELVFARNSSPAFKDLALSSRDILLKLREEAHRFGLKASRRKRQGLTPKRK